MQNLVIVESPTKAKTLARFLGKGYKIDASMGHIRDLPKSELGVDENFEPKYIIPRDKKKKVNELKKLAAGAKKIWLATDPDREGEAIAWHISQLLGGGEQKRVVFHEITEGAIKEAFGHPRELNYELIDAQQARRILDRLVGYKLSPLLWKKVKRGLSAGRVQTVALRLIVEREREIEAFKAVEYWSVEAMLTPDTVKFTASLIEKDGQKLEIKSGQEADSHVRVLEKENYIVSKVTKKEVRRNSPAPFTTSTLQQTAGNRLNMSAKKTMMLAQNLYEHGLITYMRTDSVNLSSVAVNATREYISKHFGGGYLPKAAKIYKSRSKNAQEAHEAIRPTDISLQSTVISKQGLTREHARLYDLIWKRTLASQISDALVDQTTADIGAGEYRLRATGSVLKFDGWLKVYESEDEEEKQILPELTEGQDLKLLEITPTQHFTQPPPRYTEASLIKKLEELGIGRPSTYAPILSTIQERFYVERQERKFFPTPLGLVTSDFLIKYFPEVFDYTFTAALEDQLDDIANGQREWKKTIAEFYKPFEAKLEKTTESAQKVDLPVEKVDKKCPLCGKDLIVKTSRFGKFLACSGFPECKHTESMEQKIEAKCPEDGGDIVVRKTRKGKTFYGCKNWPVCKYASWTKPK